MQCTLVNYSHLDRASRGEREKVLIKKEDKLHGVRNMPLKFLF